MNWISWGISELIGREAYLEIVDRQSGGWDHIMIDHVFQSNRDVPTEDAIDGTRRFP